MGRGSAIELSLDAPVWDATTFTRKRKRFEHHGLLRKFFGRVVADVSELPRQM